MKKRLPAVLAAAALAFVCAVLPASAAPKTLNVNGKNIWNEAKAVLIGDTTYVSVRTVAGVLAPGAAVSWRDGAAWVEDSGLSLRAKPGDLYLTVNDRALYVPNAVRNINGSVMAPIRVLAEAMGGTVEWNPSAGITLTPGSGRPGAAPYTGDELYWMARIIHAESQGEPFLGKLAVGTVVLNRVASSQFPSTIYGVIFDRKWGVQFTPVANGTIYNDPNRDSVLAAKLVLEGARAAGQSLYFLAPSISTSGWIQANRDFVTTIGNHWFYA